MLLRHFISNQKSSYIGYISSLHKDLFVYYLKQAISLDRSNPLAARLATDALEGSLFRMLRQGQRVNFELDDEGRATALKLGSEADMSTPDL